MMDANRKIRVAITGPESTGKTTLAIELSHIFAGRFIPEYAREYVENLTSHYTYHDVEAIARKQVEQYIEAQNHPEKIIFFDTWLIITKVWFEWVFGRYPLWLEDSILNCPMDLYLLCKPDLPWIADRVRENGGENRIKLYEKYRDELIRYGFRFVEVGGTELARTELAIASIHEFYRSDLKLSDI